MKNNKQSRQFRWLSIWTKPRTTIQQVLDTTPEYCIVISFAIIGITRSFQLACQRNMGDHETLRSILMNCGIIGSLGGMIWLFMLSSFTCMMGERMKSTISPRQIRTTIAWTVGLPSLLLLLISALKYKLVGTELLTTRTPRLDVNPALKELLFVFSYLEIIVMIWAGSLLLAGLAEAQKLPLWKTTIGFLLAALLAFIPAFVIVLGVIRF